MEKFSLQILLHLLQFLSLSVLSWTYTLPDNYFINCGSNSNVTINDRTFVGDVNRPGPFALFAGGSSTMTNTSLSTDYDDLYRTARIFRNPSSYELDISGNGTYMVRLHFYPFSSLYDAIFDVSAGGFSLLSNFSAKNASNLPIIKEFLLPITVDKLVIYFKASNGSSSFAFVNAIEAFLAPNGSVPDSATRVTLSGTDTAQKSLLSEVLHTVYRINVGGAKLTPDNDTLLRTWVPDDDYLFYKDAAKNSPFYSDTPKYQDGGATEYSAPDNVYQTAKEMNIDPNRQNNFFNITWHFRVKKNTSHFVRVHFCDIISPSLNYIQFNLYIYSTYGIKINSYDIVDQLAAPFYKDFLVDSDDSGFLNISVGPSSDSTSQTAFLNGLEVMEVVTRQVSVPGENKSQKKKHLFIIIGSVAGGLGLVCLLLGVLFLLKSKEAKKPEETSDWQPITLYGLGSSHSPISQRTANGSPLCNLNLGLKLSFAEIQHATNNFELKLQIGEGGFGKVYKGTLPGGIKVAVKRSQPGHGQGFSEFQTEIIVLSRIRHRHLVSLIGYCDERYEMILVYEFMEKGTLRDHLYSRYGDSRKSPSRSELTWTQRLEICIGAAEGLHYLHTSSDRGIIHRDVKSTNILLDEHYVAKVADFGLSRLGNLDQTHVSTEVKGSFGYLDPEYFGCLQLTQKSDVYSFGVVLLEVLCARPAISNSTRREEVNLAEWGLLWQRKGELEKIVDPLLQGKIDPNSLRMFGETVEKCLKLSGVERPSMHEVLWDLQYALQLQQTTRHGEARDDSTSDPSWVLPVPSVRRFPSHSVATDDESEFGLVAFTEESGSTAGEVFSQMRMEDAR